MTDKRDDRKRQVETTKERHGEDFYSRAGAKSKGGGFNDPEVASRAAKKMHELRRQKRTEKELKHDSQEGT